MILFRFGIQYVSLMMILTTFYAFSSGSGPSFTTTAWSPTTLLSKSGTAIPRKNSLSRFIPCTTALSMGANEEDENNVDSDDEGVEVNVNDEANAKEKPEYKPLQRACDFLANPYFYDDEEFAKVGAKKRKEVFGEMLIGELFQKVKTRDELVLAIEGCGLNHRKVTSYWRELQSPEGVLDGKCLYINDKEGVEGLAYIAGIGDGKLRHCSAGTENEKRIYDIHLVLGSSGSGKTAFSLKDLAKKVRSSKSFSVYLQADENFDIDKTVSMIRRKIEKELEKAQIFFPFDDDLLDMGMSLVIDEAGNLKKKFDSLDHFKRMRDLLNENFVKGKVRLVVAGTGYDSLVQNLDSRTDVYKYQMQPWSVESIEAYIKNSSGMSISYANKYVLKCLQKYSLLSQLGSNARMCTYLFCVSNEIDFQYLFENDDVSILSRLVSNVSFEYIYANGLAKLTPERRRMVARVVLQQLQESGRDFEISPKKPEKPKYSLLDEEYADKDLNGTVVSLVEQNYEVSNSEDREVQLIEEAYPAVIVTPAIAILIYTMLGASSSVVAGWKGLEVVGALSFLRQAVLVPNLDDKELESLVLNQASIPFPASNAMYKFQIPWNIKSHIWLNGPLGSFGDYFDANRKCIGQAKFSKDRNASTTIEFYNECFKCGLLREKVVEDVGGRRKKNLLRGGLLRALEHRSKVDVKTFDESHQDTSSVGAGTGTALTTEVKLHCGHLYPESLLIRADRDAEQMVSCTVNHELDKVSFPDGPELDIKMDSLLGWQLHFVTNGASMTLQLKLKQKQKQKEAEAETEAKVKAETERKRLEYILEHTADIPDKLVLSRADVDMDGVVKAGKKKDILHQWETCYLRENDVLRFFFIQ